jgi:hypothetical protein
MRSVPRTKLSRVRLGGTAAILAGLCYTAAGYLDRPGISGFTGALVLVLNVAIPALFLGGLLGLHTHLLLAARTSLASAAGLVLGCFGSVLGCFGSVLGIGGALGLAPPPYWPITWWWWVPFLAGLTLMGLFSCLKGGLWLLGTVVSISGALGWVSLLTDPDFSGVLVPMRSVHVAFAAAFCLSCVVWGAVLMVPHENR